MKQSNRITEMSLNQRRFDKDVLNRGEQGTFRDLSHNQPDNAHGGPDLPLQSTWSLLL